MKDVSNNSDKRIRLLDALLRYASASGEGKPQFYQDETLVKLGLCENVFIDLQMLIGDKCCRMNDCHDGRILFGINPARCQELRKHILMRNEKVSYIKSTKIKIITALYGALGAIILGQFLLLN